MTQPDFPTKIILDYDAELVAKFVAEFRENSPFNDDFDVVCIQKSTLRPNDCHVFLLTSPKLKFALKLDKTAHLTGRLANEFQKLIHAQSCFPATSNQRVTTPIYLSETGNFMVTEFIDAPTALQLFRNASSQAETEAVFRSCGAWLKTLHSSKEGKTMQFWPGWMLEMFRDEKLLSKTKIPKDVLTPVIASLTKEAQGLKGAWDKAVPSHGDLHGNNLIIDDQAVYGLDFSESKGTLAAYDVAKILLMDLERDHPGLSIGQSGTVEAYTTAFLDAYGLKLNLKILTFCLKTRLIRTWFRVTQDRYDGSVGQKRRYDEIERRVKLIFP